MKKIFLILIIFSIEKTHAFNLFTGVNKSLNDVQDKNGKEAKNPFSPALSVSENFKLPSEFGFSPQLGYIHNTITSDDSYGKYRMYTLFILYDFIWVPSDQYALRFGIGNFMKTIKGDGDTVTVPNGATGTSTAYTAGKTSTSFTNTLNLGGDMKFNISTDWFKDIGARFEIFVFRFLSSEYRNYSFNIGAVAYF